MAKKKAAEIIELSRQEAMNLTERIKDKKLTDSDYVVLELLVSERVMFTDVLQEKNLSIKRLRRIFNIKTEKLANILKGENKAESEVVKEGEGISRDHKSKLAEDRQKAKGHGRNGVSAYRNAESIKISLQKGVP